MTPDPLMPLAGRMRPAARQDFVGQQHLLADGKPLARMLAGGALYSMILWGPPGSGKTTLAQMLSHHAQAEWITLSAVTGGVQDIRRAVQQAQSAQQSGRRTVLFVDEVHRFNKAQQDAFLPHIEQGTIILIGATTENPSFELNGALLSRVRVHLLQPLGEPDLAQLMHNALNDHPHGLGERHLQLEQTARQALITAAQGDARRLLSMLEIAADLVGHNGGIIDAAIVNQVIDYRVQQFDKHGDHFYDQISALHKSIRGSDPDAALYWLHRMLLGGCDPHYVLRRLVRVASEDIGNADPRALTLALDAWSSFDRLGAAEGELAISQAVVYLSVAAKSNAVYAAHKAAIKAAKAHHHAAVPVHIRNAPTKLARTLGMGRHYRYAHDEPLHFSAGQTYFPDDMTAEHFYRPDEQGLEKQIAARLAHWRALNAQAGGTQ